MNCSELIQQTRGPGLIAFSDAAGAKACLALASMLRRERPDVTFRAVTNRRYPFYADWDSPVEVVNDPNAVSLEGCHWLFAGTSHPDSSGGFELGIIERARRAGVASAAFVDHSTNLALRFRSGSGLVLPDTIFLLRPELVRQAIIEGLPSDRLQTLENPHLAYIRNYWRSTLSRERFCELFRVQPEVRKIFVFAPDPVSLRSQTQRLSFDEYSVLQGFMQLIRARPEAHLIVKAHPLQDLARLADAAGEVPPGNFFLDPTGLVDNLELMHHADAVIGFYSNFLLEAQALGSRVIRYFPPGPDDFALLFEGIGRRAGNLQELAALLDE